ncbi:PLP-dependent transferase [Providencia hangzhouensis]
MVNHSATMSHGSMTKEERESIGDVYDTTLRLSVGIEDITDLLNDLENALS